jgi:acyl-[acyl carrier protein]--UDP-N-acetylglucosamine O-acyltransferase
VATIHPTALVDPKAQIDPTVTIGPYSVVGPDVCIGRGTRVGAHCVIEGQTRIGQDNQIFQFNSIGAIPQDKKYAGERSELHIGDGQHHSRVLHHQPRCPGGRWRHAHRKPQLDHGLLPYRARLPRG